MRKHQVSVDGQNVAHTSAVLTGFPSEWHYSFQIADAALILFIYVSARVPLSKT
jgi:hypothetical protein